MKQKKRWMIGITFAAVIVTTGVFLYDKAETAVLQAKYEELVEQERKERAILESMPSNTEEEIQKQVEQGQKVKAIGWEAGQLSEKLNPISPKDQLMHDIAGQVDYLPEREHHYKWMSTDPRGGPHYARAYEILQDKKKTLEQIDKDFKEGNKSVKQLRKELDEWMQIQELY